MRTVAFVLLASSLAWAKPIVRSVPRPRHHTKCTYQIHIIRSPVRR